MNKQHPVPKQQQARNLKLESLRPDRGQFQDQESYEEALSGFNHRVVPLLRPVRFKESPAPSTSPAGA